MTSKQKTQTWIAIAFFFLSLEAADDVCATLDHLVWNETLSQDNLF